MLFLLTGEVQIGKTRWLEKLVADLAERGVPCAGVLAPGQWVASAGERADGNGYEKLGIDNVLLPVGERVPFARRGDLARADGTFDKDSQAARAELAWHISDAAIERVNAHFEKLRSLACAESVPESEGSPRLRRPGLLVVDELGRLEIWRGGGLTEAVALLAEGPSAAFPHALVVVRDYLADDAEALLADVWPDRIRIAPDESGRAAVLSAVRAAELLSSSLPSASRAVLGGC